MELTPQQAREIERQKALDAYHILDTLPEPEYDDIALLAAQICQTPISMITLVDDTRQWFKAAHGLAVKQTPKEGGFCTNTVNHPGVLSIVEDAGVSEQFAQHPLVTGEPNIVFYAGAPLIDSQGLALGSLCVIDQQARQLSAEQFEALRALSRQVVRLLELRKQTFQLQALQQQVEQEKRALQLSEQRFRTVIEQAPMAIGQLRGPEFVIEVGNAQLFEVWGKDASVLGKRLIEALPELEGQPFIDLMKQVYTTGVPFEGNAVLAKLIRRDRLEEVYFNFSYSPLRDEQGVITSILILAVEVTQQVRARQAVERSEQQFSQLIQQAPYAMALYQGPQLLIAMANPSMIQLWGKTPAVIGQPLIEALPELEGQPFVALLEQVYATGQPYRTTEQAADLVVEGQLRRSWFNFVYQPLFDPAGKVYAILNMAVDITDNYQARQALAESTNALQNAIQVGGLGTFSIDISTGLLNCSPRMAEWFGFQSLTAEIEAFIQRVSPDQQERVRQHLADTIAQSPSGRYDITYSVINAETGQKTIIHALGRVYFDEEGYARKVEGIALDITAQLELQLFLETQVQRRTQELTLANQDLQRSNDNLQQFAYVASHDLQEPLRKIQSFSTLLVQHLNEPFDQTASDYLNRIVKSASRMSTLIKDLLGYSRIATRQQAFGPISLNAVVASVVETLSLEIEQRQAQLDVDELPIVNGDGSQLGQLFQNLLSNAIKFTPPGQVPRVHVAYFQRQVAELPPQVKPNREALFYHQVSVSDRGVGFDTKYLDRIFQVFQRLHNQDQFPGTGVGLAICQRVVENHGGAITASSQPGQGATFCVYLPA